MSIARPEPVEGGIVLCVFSGVKLGRENATRYGLTFLRYSACSFRTAGGLNPDEVLYASAKYLLAEIDGNEWLRSYAARLRISPSACVRECSMNWCDKLGSTPAIGYQLDWHTLPSDILLDALSSLVDGMVSGDEQRFTIDLKDALKLTFTSHDGFQFGLEPARIFVEFRHRAAYRIGAGGIPNLVLNSKPSPYTELLDEVQRYLQNTMEIVNRLKVRRLIGIGVVATTVVDEHDVPPGIRKLLTHVSNPWQGKLETLTFQAQTIVHEDEEFSHRCTHTVVKKLKNDDPMDVIFDYQRVYKKPPEVDASRLRTATEKVKSVALDYFEQLAQGDRFDDFLNNADSK